MAQRIPGTQYVAQNLCVTVTYLESQCDRSCRSHDGSPCYHTPEETRRTEHTGIIPLTEYVRYDQFTGEVTIRSLDDDIKIDGRWVPRERIVKALVKPKLPDPVWN